MSFVFSLSVQSSGETGEATSHDSGSGIISAVATGFWEEAKWVSEQYGIWDIDDDCASESGPISAGEGDKFSGSGVEEAWRWIGSDFVGNGGGELLGNGGERYIGDGWLMIDSSSSQSSGEFGEGTSHDSDSVVIIVPVATGFWEEAKWVSEQYGIWDIDDDWASESGSISVGEEEKFSEAWGWFGSYFSGNDGEELLWNGGELSIAFSGSTQSLGEEDEFSALGE